MHLSIHPLKHMPCHVDIEINGIEARDTSFGHTKSGYDAYGCINHVFVPVHFTQKVLTKFGINRKEYSSICAKLRKALTFSSCGMCD